MEPASKLEAMNASGAGHETTPCVSFTARERPSHASEWISDAPPGVFRNCVGGLTWNGRTANARVNTWVRFDRLCTKERAKKGESCLFPRARIAQPHRVARASARTAFRIPEGRAHLPSPGHLQPSARWPNAFHHRKIARRSASRAHPVANAESSRRIRAARRNRAPRPVSRLEPDRCATRLRDRRRAPIRLQHQEERTMR